MFIAADRPYGLIEATVTREEARGATSLADFNERPTTRRARAAARLPDVPRWADEVLAGRPYDDVDEVGRAMVAASATITDDELERRPRAPPADRRARRRGQHDAAHSTREQSGVDRDDADVVRRLEEGNRAYEERFGRVFIIRAAGRGGREILGSSTRLDNTDEAERPRPSTS